MAQATEIETKDHKEIKAWVNARNGTPARLSSDSTGKSGSPLTIWFREAERDVKQSFMALEWDEFFDIFDKNEHTFKYTTAENNDFCQVL